MQWYRVGYLVVRNEDHYEQILPLAFVWYTLEIVRLMKKLLLNDQLVVEQTRSGVGILLDVRAESPLNNEGVLG